MAELLHKSALDLSKGFKAGEYSATEIVEEALSEIQAKEEKISAFLEVSEDLARKSAQRLDEKRAKGEELGCLAGIPMGFKDNMNLKGTRTTCASKMLENYESPFDATCVARCIEEGALPLGKTNMDEFAFGSSTESSAFKKTKNPWDTNRVPGGSSGGSAAAVAAGEVSLSLGSDTGGSIRQPASFCGVVGFKPSYGVVSRYGVVAFGSSLDQVGPFAKTVDEVALCMEALTKGAKDPYDSTSQDARFSWLESLQSSKLEEKTKRLGVVRQLFELEGISAEVKATLQQALERFEAAGVELVDVDLPHMEAAIAAYYVIAPCEAFSNLARFDGVRYGHQAAGFGTLAEQSAHSRAEGFGLEAKRRQLLGAYLLSSGVYDEYYVRAQKVRTLITADYEKAFEGVEALLLPTAPKVAWNFGEMDDPTAMYASDLFTISNNIAGNCGISVPVALGAESGMPIGLQLQAKAFDDVNLLRWAKATEELRGDFALDVAVK